MAKKSKEAARREDVSRQREEVRSIMEQFLDQLVPGSEEFNQLLAEGQRLIQTVESPASEQEIVRQLGQQLVSQQLQRVKAGGAATPLEARTQASFDRFRKQSELVPFEQDIFRLLQGEAPATAAGRTFLESLGISPEDAAVLAGLRGEPSSAPVAGLVSDIAGRARAPVGNIESFDRFKTTLPERLELVRGLVENQFARRGITPTSGLALEGLGRAGLETTIAEEAAARDAFLRASELRQREIGNRQTDINTLLELLNVGRAIPREQQERTERLFNVGEQLRGRQIGVEDALVRLQLGRESRITDLLASQAQAGFGRQADLLQRQTGRAEQLTDLAEQREEQRRQELIQLAKTGGALAASVAFPAGAPAFLAAAGTPMGGTSPQAFPLSGAGRGTSIADLLAGSREASEAGGLSLSSDLSRIDPSLYRLQFPEEELFRRRGRQF